MKPYKLAYLFFLIFFSVYSQERENNSENSNSYITASIWPTFDLFAPRLRVGYVQQLAPHWKAGIDVGYGTEGLSILSLEKNTGIEYSLWEVRPEVYYILNPEAKALKYLSAELFYINQDHVFVNGAYTAENNQDFSFDRADFSRLKYGMHFKFGLFLNVGKHFGFNFFGGLGFRIADKQYSNVINPQVGSDFLDDSPFIGPYENEGKDFRFNPSLGIKFYYKI